MTNENNETDENHNQDDRIVRHLEEFGPSAFGGSDLLKSIMLKSLSHYYPEVDLSSLRIARELNFTQTLMMTWAEEYLRSSGLSWSKLFILLCLRAMQDAGEKGLNPSTLSGHLSVTRNTVSTLLGGLERQGYITREMDPEDKRRFVIRLTPAGWEAVERSSEPLFRHLQILLGSMNCEQRVALVHGLMELQRAIIKDRPELAARSTPPILNSIEE
jgi:DNA-binding MarR family transcriptional regulator